MRKVKGLISIGIPFYNAENFLDFAICSVLNQTYTNWELFLLDDGSTDNSLSVIKKYEKDSRISVLSDGENKGLPTRLNQLSNLSNGKYYARMDADDVMFPTRLEKQYFFLENNCEIDIVGTGAIVIDANNTITGLRNVLTGQVKIKSVYEVLKKGLFIHPSVMGKSSWFKKNPYDIKLKRAQDLDLWARSIEGSKFHVLNEPLLFYREDALVSLNKALKANLYTIKIATKHQGKLSKVQFFEIYFKSYSKSFIYLVCNVLGLMKLLVNRRSIKLSTDESIRLASILSKSLIFRYI
ncbi:MAG: glycosyltransferase family 2 protein [Flavobacteriaceae bacterium]|nr:glycosyltransferase family 2 protein [Flavobacteriaceae bacterium]